MIEYSMETISKIDDFNNFLTYMSDVEINGFYTLTKSVVKPMNEEIFLLKEVIIDGSNVAYNFRGNSNYPLLDHILVVRDFFLNVGAKPTVIVDHTLSWQIDRHDELKTLVDQELIHKTPRGLKADGIILKLAFDNNGYVVSNDRFRPYWDTYTKEAIEERRIAFKIINGEFFYTQPTYIAS